MKPKVLIIDDEKSIRDIFTLLLEEKGYAVEAAERKGRHRPGEGLPAGRRPPGHEPPRHVAGWRIPRSRKPAPGAEIVIITAFGTIRNAVEATKLGAYAYLEKPVDNEELLLILAGSSRSRRWPGRSKRSSPNSRNATPSPTSSARAPG